MGTIREGREIDQILNFFFSILSRQTRSDTIVEIPRSNYEIIEQRGTHFAVVSGLFRFIGVCSFHREHRYYALEITWWCTHHGCASCWRVRFAKPSRLNRNWVRSIRTAFPWNYEHWPPGFYLFSRFISKIPFRIVRYMYIHVHSVGALRCINRWIFRSDSRWNSWLSKVSTPRAFNEI